MAAPDIVTIKVHLKTAPWQDPPAEVWTFANMPDGDESLAVDEHSLEDELRDTFIDAGGRNTLSISRTSTWGGWGADGLSALEIVISVIVSVGSAALYDGIKSIYRRHTGVEPEANKELGSSGEGGPEALPEATKPEDDVDAAEDDADAPEDDE